MTVEEDEDDDEEDEEGQLNSSNVNKPHLGRADPKREEMLGLVMERKRFQPGGFPLCLALKR